MADKVLKYKYIVKNVCYRNGYTATFMPKPLFGDNGSGMHTHQSLWNDDTPLFYDKNGYALLSRDVPPLHRRPAEARAGDPGLRRADDQQLPPPGAGLRGADQPGVLAAQPQRLRPHPDVLEQPEGAAPGVPRPRSVVQPVPGVLGHADGRPGRRA